VPHRSSWLIEVKAWQRSGLSRRGHLCQHQLDAATFAQWLNVLADAVSLRLQRDIETGGASQR
jgi:hypothetical protein